MTNDFQAKLSEMLGGQAGENPTARLRETLMARLGETAGQDPVRGMLRQMLEGQLASKPQTRSAPPESETIAGMRKLLRAALRELKVMNRRDARLAMALGACADCWGQDPECQRCSGDGSPGWTDPEPVAFEEYVAPALRSKRAFGAGK